MKITGLNLRELTGTLQHEGEFWEERLIRPIDIYPEHKVEGATWIEALGPGQYRNVAHFVEIGTDAGFTGIGGPMPLEQAFIVERSIKPLLLGHDPLAT